MHSLVDICFNCTHDSFQSDLDAVLRRASNQGVNQMLCPASSLADSYEVIGIVKKHPQQLSAGVGVHPHLAREWHSDTFDELARLAKTHQCVSVIGETGLDYCRNYSTPQKQHVAFEQQIELAIQTKLPIFLHQRDAHRDFLAILSSHRHQLSYAVIHCFTGDKKQLSDYLDLDLYVGITGWICDERRGVHLRELIQHIPKQRLLIETDAPYLLPRSLRPKPKQRHNEPAFLSHIATEIAECLNMPFADLAECTRFNAQTFLAQTHDAQAENTERSD